LILMPIIYVLDTQTSVDFYKSLGFELVRQSRPGRWAELRRGEALLSLHAIDDLPTYERPRVELCFVTTEPLKQVRARLLAAGVTTVDGILDEAFGRSLTVRDPDGLRVQINEHDEALYT